MDWFSRVRELVVSWERGYYPEVQIRIGMKLGRNECCFLKGGSERGVTMGDIGCAA
jgi:hypothetical protein